MKIKFEQFKMKKINEYRFNLMMAASIETSTSFNVYLYIIEQALCLFLSRCLGRYFSKNSNWRAFKAPCRFWRINSTASSYGMPSSMRARATMTGARPKPATQWIATQVFGFCLNCSFNKPNHLSLISGGGVWPSGKAASFYLYDNCYN